jgi:hypothetical protein
MCEELTMRPRAIHAYELSNKQLRALEEINKGRIVSAWRTSEGAVVYMSGIKPNCYLWQKKGWVEVRDDA